MKFHIPLKDIMIAPGKRLDPEKVSREEVISLIKKTYKFIADTMNITVGDGMVTIEFRDATPEKVNSAYQKLQLGVSEAQKGQLKKAIALFKEVLAVIPENVEARRNMAKAYIELGNLEMGKKHLQECIQISPGDSWAYVMLANIYSKGERNLDVAEFYYEKAMETDPQNSMVLNNYAAVMMEKGNFQKAEVLFKKALKQRADFPHTYFGLAMLYKVTGHLEESAKVLERLFIMNPYIKGIDGSAIYGEARNLYQEISRELKTKDKAH